MGTRPREEVLAAVRAYTAAVAGCPPDHITDVSRFEDGNRHDVYKVSHLDGSGGTRDLVVRVSYRGDKAERTQAEREARVLERTGGVAAPVLHDFRCRSPWFETPTMCMEFVPGRQIDLSSASPAEIEQLGQVVAWVHARRTDGLVDPPPAADTTASYAAMRLESILSTLVWARDPLPGAVQARLRAAAHSLERTWESVRDTESFRTRKGLALLHGDIAPGNVLWHTGPVLIDWEYSRLGDPADEIAYLFDQNGLSRQQRDAFWTGYREEDGGQADLRVIERVEWWEPLALFGSTLWWIERWVRRTESDSAGRVDPDVPRDPVYYLDRVIRRLDRLETILARR